MMLICARKLASVEKKMLIKGFFSHDENKKKVTSRRKNLEKRKEKLLKITIIFVIILDIFITSWDFSLFDFSHTLKILLLTWRITLCEEWDDDDVVRFKELRLNSFGIVLREGKRTHWKIAENKRKEVKKKMWKENEIREEILNTH